MSFNDYLKCPGVDNALYSIPKEVACPECNGFAEVWTDEKKGTCPECGKVIKNKSNDHSNGISTQQIDSLIETALQIGATGAKDIFSSEIIVEEDLASLCNGEPACENYGLSMSCPPHVQGPVEFKKWQDNSQYSIVVRIDLPSEIMFSKERRSVMQLLHKIVATVELKAIDMGFTKTKSFAGSSCKQLFCNNEPDCRVVSKQGKCRNPKSARPSMSGFGINVVKLMQSAGWQVQMSSREKSSNEESMSWVAGLVLIGLE